MKKNVVYNTKQEANMEYRVDFTWDEEASVWIAQSDDIPYLP